jgi:hypothetical protein
MHSAVGLLLQDSRFAVRLAGSRCQQRQKWVQRSRWPWPTRPRGWRRRHRVASRHDAVMRPRLAKDTPEQTRRMTGPHGRYRARHRWAADLEDKLPDGFPPGPQYQLLIPVLRPIELINGSRRVKWRGHRCASTNELACSPARRQMQYQDP